MTYTNGSNPEKIIVSKLTGKSSEERIEILEKGYETAKANSNKEVVSVYEKFLKEELASKEKNDKEKAKERKERESKRIQKLGIPEPKRINLSRQQPRSNRSSLISSGTSTRTQTRSATRNTSLEVNNSSTEKSSFVKESLATLNSVITIDSLKCGIRVLDGTFKNIKNNPKALEASKEQVEKLRKNLASFLLYEIQKTTKTLESKFEKIKEITSTFDNEKITDKTISALENSDILKNVKKEIIPLCRKALSFEAEVNEKVKINSENKSKIESQKSNSDLKSFKKSYEPTKKVINPKYFNKISKKTDERKFIDLVKNKQNNDKTI